MKVLWPMSLATCFVNLALAISVEYNFGNGAIYKGNVDESGRPSGRGSMLDSEGNLEYEGGFSCGLAHGWGIWHGPNGDLFEGTFQHGLPKGKGVLRTKQGRRVEGNFKPAKLSAKRTGFLAVLGAPEAHGEGVVAVLGRGDRVEGQFRHGVPHGHVVWRRPEGQRVSGAFRMGRLHGTARFTDVGSNVTVDAVFFDGLPDKPIPGFKDKLFDFAPSTNLCHSRSSSQHLR